MRIKERIYRKVLFTPDIFSNNQVIGNLSDNTFRLTAPEGLPAF